MKLPHALDSASRAGLGLALVLSSLAGCAEDGAPVRTLSEVSDSDDAEAIAAQDRALNLIARTKLGSGTLSVYEPEPGTIIERQTGRIGDASAHLGNDLTFASRYALLSGKFAPQALVHAERRASHVQATQSARGEEQLAEPVVPDSAPLEKAVQVAPTEEWFIQGYCEHEDRFWGGTRLTGDSFFEGSGINYIKVGAYAYRGEMQHRYTHTNTVNSDPIKSGLFPGAFVAYREQTKINRSASSGISQADGDGYHHCVNYHF